MKKAIWICVAVLIVLHQDYWQWDNGTLDFGFMPRALTYHVIISVMAAFVWLVATHFCWPTIPDSENQSQPTSQGNGEDAS